MLQNNMNEIIPFLPCLLYLSSSLACRQLTALCIAKPLGQRIWYSELLAKCQRWSSRILPVQVALAEQTLHAFLVGSNEKLEAAHHVTR